MIVFLYFPTYASKNYKVSLVAFLHSLLNDDEAKVNEGIPGSRGIPALPLYDVFDWNINWIMDLDKGGG